MNTDKIYLNAFNLAGEIGPVRVRKLLNFFPDLKAAWLAGAGELSRAGLEEAVVLKLLDRRREIDPEAEFLKLEQQGIGLLTPAEPEYPKRLKEIHNPPALLYILGELTAADEMCLAVVGSRRMTGYGQRIAQELVHDLVMSNLTIVSGLALGVDAAAHRTAIEAGGRTIAVLGSGLDAIYPSSNRALAEKILAGRGAILSELPLGTAPYKSNFPHRNRLISGLSLGVLIVEGAADSGSLITARHALEQNREVFAVPGSIFSELSAGPHQLIKLGAKLVAGSADILEELNLNLLQEQFLTKQIIGDTKEEQLILDQLSREPVLADRLAQTTKLRAAQVAATLTILEMKGKVKNLGGNQYVLAR